jgi:hypothetical protein
MNKTKKNIKVRDLKPQKDAKGGRQIILQGSTAPSGGTSATGGSSADGTQKDF